MKQLKSIEFKNYKALEDFRIDLDDYNVIVGANNSGKSTIISSLKLLKIVLDLGRRRNPERFEIDNEIILGYIIPKSLIPISIENVHTDYNDNQSKIQFRFSDNSTLNIHFSKNHTCFMTVPRPSGIHTTKKFKEVFNYVLGCVPTLGPLEQDEDLLSKDTVEKSLGSHKANRHFRNYWHHYPEGFEKFSKLVESTWTGMSIRPPEIINRNDQGLVMFCSEDRIPRELFWSGFGFQIWCQLLTHLSRMENVSIIVVDEPEVYLHPEVQRQLIILLKNMGKPFVIATHSTEIIAEVEPQDLIYIDKKRIVSQRLKNFDDMQFALNKIGSINNLTLAKLAKTKRMIFVEGDQDFKVLRRFAKKLNLEKFASGIHAVPVETRGFGSWESAGSAAWGINVALTPDFRKAIVYDRDFFPEEQLDKIKTELQKGFDLVLILTQKEIENYLLNLNVIQRIVANKLDNTNKATFNAEAVLSEITEPYKTRCMGQYSAKRADFYRKIGRDSASSNEEAIREVEECWENLTSRLRIVPGKEVLKDLRTYLSKKYGISLSDTQIIEGFQRADFPNDLENVLRQLESFCS
jgi:AAA ATPase domain